MSWTRTRIAIGSALALALVPLFTFARSDDMKGQADKITGQTLLAPGDLKWIPLPGIDGAMMVPLAGDPAKGPHRAFFKFPVGLKAPLHTHSFGDRAVIVSGTLSIALEGAEPKKLPPGSFFSLGAGVKHVTAVEGSEPCVFYIEREGPFDVVMAEAKAQKK